MGQTNNIVDRLKRHNFGYVRSTKSGVPWDLVWVRLVHTRKEAMNLEKKIKKRGIVRFLIDTRLKGNHIKK